MADDKGPVRLAPPPPDAMLEVMNVVMKPLLASPLGRRINGVMLLEFRGRRTGRTIRTPVNFNDVDGVPTAFTLRPWRLNFEGGATATVTHRGHKHVTRGTLVPVTAEEMAHAVRESLDHGGSAQRMGIRTAKGHQPTEEELASLGPGLGTSVIRFDFTP